LVSRLLLDYLTNNYNFGMRVCPLDGNDKEEKMITIRRAIILFGATIFFLVMTSGVSARPFRLGKLPDKGDNFSCGTCHVNPNGGGARNPFGKDYAKVGMKAGDKYTKDLGEKDSDKDGISNDKEFEAGTNPGDSDSK
jgi:hypothetical protein